MDRKLTIVSSSRECEEVCRPVLPGYRHKKARSAAAPAREAREARETTKNRVIAWLEGIDSPGVHSRAQCDYSLSVHMADGDEIARNGFRAAGVPSRSSSEMSPKLQNLVNGGLPRSTSGTPFGPLNVVSSRAASLSSRKINLGRSASDTPTPQAIPRGMRKNASFELQEEIKGPLRTSRSLSARSTPVGKPTLATSQPISTTPPQEDSAPTPQVQLADTIISSTGLSFPAFCSCVKRYGRVVKNEHEYQVKHDLGRTRLESQSRRRQNKLILKGKGVFGNRGSPFRNTASVHVDSATGRHQKGKFGKLAQVQNKASKSGSDAPRYYKISSFLEPVSPVPGYAHYSPLQHNVLVEDDKQRTFMPWQGDDDQVQELDEEKRRVEAMIERNQKTLHQLMDCTERARPYVPFLQEMLQEMGCDVDDTLRFLMTEDYTSSAPPILPKNLTKSWHDRSVHLQEGYYSDSSASDASSSEEDYKKYKRPRLQWQEALKALPKLKDEKRHVAAGLACIAFKEVAGFSLWNVLRVLYTSQDPLAGKSRDKLGGSVETEVEDDTFLNSAQVATQGSTWLMLGCVVCKRHDCPGHGEFDDTDVVDNDRRRVNFELPAEDQVIFEVGPLDFTRPHVQLRTFVGLNGSGVTEGENWASRAKTSILADADLCTGDCFWVKSNRASTPSISKLPWATQDEELLESFLGVYSEDQRGPCLLFRTGVFNKSCMEIFERIVTRVPSREGRSGPRPDAASVPVGRKPGADYWLENFPGASKLDQRDVFYPCSHAGPCSANSNCRCFQQGITCEKACACPPDCVRRFQGCSCTTKAARICLTDRCPCYAMNRECSPDLCRGCGAHEVLDPANKRREDIARGRCQNVAIQRSVPKRTLLGTSKLLLDGGKFGYGLYMGEPCRKDDFVGEYTGEVLSDREAETRGFIYDTIEMSYLFTLNKWQVLDSMIFGNKMRFINDQNEGMANCRPRTLLCNSVTRIGMFAQRDIDVGEELFFDYGPDFRKKFDLIKRDIDGKVITVKRDTGGAAAALAGKMKAKGKKPPRTTGTGGSANGSILVRGKNGERPYRVSKNGRRIGRPPKALQKRRWSETGLADDHVTTPTATTSRGRGSALAAVSHIVSSDSE